MSHGAEPSMDAAPASPAGSRPVTSAAVRRCERAASDTAASLYPPRLATTATEATDADTGTQPMAAQPTTTKDTTGAVPPADASPAAPTAKFDIPADAGPVALREAAAGGDPKALFEIGSRYAEGRGVKADMKAAAKWYEKAAELGFAPAQYRIGNFYEKGIGVDRDIAKAKTWYQMAAEQGNASAMHNLAVLFAMGADGAADNKSAARWFQKAAELGVKDSQFNLGILAAKGVGMPQNLEESYKWFALVAKTGDRDAATKRDEIANALRPEQLRAGARRDRTVEGQAGQCRNQHRDDIPECMARERCADDRQRRHEAGGPQHPADPQQERLRCRLAPTA